MNFTNKVVVVTGAASGIGEAIALSFAKLNASLSIIDLNEENLLKTKRECEELSKTKVLEVVADLKKDEDVKKTIELTLKEFGKIDVLVNCAGIAVSGGIEDSDIIEKFDKVMSINLRAMIVMTKEALPALIESKGCIINLSSVASTLTANNLLPYSISKAAVTKFTKSAAFDLGRKGVRVNCISPGSVKTNILINAGINKDDNDHHYDNTKEMAPLNKNIKAGEIAELAVYLASDKAESITGSDFVIDAGILLGSQLEKDVHANVEKWLDESESRTNRPREATIVPEAAAAAPVSAVSYPAFPGNSIEQLAYTLRDMMDNSALQREERLLSRLATPRELPVFSGDCIEWLHFKCVYEESARLCRYNDSENLWRLRRALRGDAREAVTDLLIGNTPPAAVMEALELRFGRSDVIIMTITAQLKRLPPLPTNYQQELINFSVKVNNCVATIRALKQEDYLRSPELATAIITKLPSTLIGKWTDFAYNKILDGRSKLELMAMFLKNEAEMMSVVGLAVPNEERKMREASEKRIIEKRFIKRPVFITAHESDEKCKYCRKSKHTLPECRMFKRAMRKDKWRFVKNSGLCFCCLLTRHDKNTCKAPVCDIDGCGQPHHNLLHWTKPQSVNEMENDLGAPASSTVAHVASDNKHTDKIMLKVVSVQLRGPKGVVSVYALLDDAATVSMIDSELADSLGLVDQQASAIKFVDAFGIEVLQSDAPKVSAHIFNNNNCRDCYDITLRKVSKLNLPTQDLSIVNEINCKHLLHVKEYVCTERVKPLLLIGEDNYHLVAPLEIIPGSKNEPYATRCRLGWTIHGYCGRTHTHDCERIFSLSHIDDVNESDNIKKLNELIRDSFALESIGISTVRRENTAQLKAIQVLDETSRHLGDRWEVGLPFKRDNFTMPDSYCSANYRLQSLLRKFHSDNVYAERYRHEVNKLFDNGYARVLGENEPCSNHVWYIPHFGVQNINKPGKLRLVFDAASKVEGVCLNDYLCTGPDLYNSLMGIMFRFRENEIVIMGDIKDMFLQIKIRAEDQNVLRFLWQESPDSQIKACVMQRLIFGATCSPFIAQYIRNKNALKYEDLYPEAVSVIINNHYMDDCLYSTNDKTNAIELVKQITCIHNNGGFEIRNWSSNSQDVLASVPPDALTHSAVQFKHGAMNTTERTLGLMWSDGQVNICFVSGKSRVTPLRPVSIPRLELQGALLAARLATAVQKEHKDIKIDERFFWTDSSTVLMWLRSDPRTFKPFVAHRLGELDELTTVPEWRYVPSSSNVADVATKEDSSPLEYRHPWFQGPDFLRQSENNWPKDFKKGHISDTAACEERSVNLVSYQAYSVLEAVLIKLLVLCCQPLDL
ncbi:uncharacterized protein [Epargyreus clarus]|uniref:uncharacterized protein n=1 Tax=Epargyreus clarus TaxID=520877 RepID=UPI003C2BA5CE